MESKRMRLTQKLSLFLMTAILLLFSVCIASANALVYPDFSSTAGLTINGAARTTSTSDGAVLRLVPAAAYKAGSAFSSTALNITSFSTFFSFRITKPGGYYTDYTDVGADGIVFVIQPVRASSIGSNGGGIGYEGISPSIGVEFDTWQNRWDYSSNHIGIDINGNMASVNTVNMSPNFDDGNRWYVWIDYNGTTLEVRASETPTRPALPVLSNILDIPAIIGAESAYVGFTAGTGGDWEDSDIIYWQYHKFKPAPVPAINKVYGESIWNYHNCRNKPTSPGTYLGYAQVPYKGRNDSHIGRIVAQGSNLDMVTSVSMQERDYSVIGVHKIGTTQLKLDIRANYVGEPYPMPATNAQLVFNYSGGTISKTVNLLPTFYKDDQSWGQSTWYAGLVKRIENQQSEVRCYSTTDSSCGWVAISGDPNSTGFPKKGSVLVANNALMAYLENITLKNTVKNSNGSTTYTYILSGSQYNAECDVSKSSFSTDSEDNKNNLIVRKSKKGTYSITQLPTVVSKVTMVHQ